jgi:hypothetical protein
MRIEIKRSTSGWDVVQGDEVVASAPNRSGAIRCATALVRSTGQVLQIIAEPERANEATAA